jgi:hypothetical protein
MAAPFTMLGREIKSVFFFHFFFVMPDLIRHDEKSLGSGFRRNDGVGDYYVSFPPGNFQPLP